MGDTRNFRCAAWLGAVAASMLLGAAGAMAPATAGAQDFPNKLVRIVVPNSAGTILDLLSRIMAPDMAKSLGQSVIVENKPGANNIIGLEYVAKQAPADGYTIVTSTVSVLATLPLLAKDLRFDPHNDLPPLIGLVDTRSTLSASAKMPYKNFRDMVTYAKRPEPCSAAGDGDHPARIRPQCGACAVCGGRPLPAGRGRRGNPDGHPR